MSDAINLLSLAGVDVDDAFGLVTFADINEAEELASAVENA